MATAGTEVFVSRRRSHRRVPAARGNRRLVSGLLDLTLAASLPPHLARLGSRSSHEEAQRRRDKGHWPLLGVSQQALTVLVATAATRSGRGGRRASRM